MTPKLNKSAESKLLDTLCRGLTLHLFANNVYPKRGDIPGTYDEPIGGGYLPQRLPDELWQKTRGDYSRDSLIGIRIEFGGPVGLIYGYYVTDDDNSVVWSERFEDGPYEIQQAGEYIELDISAFVEQSTWQSP